MWDLILELLGLGDRTSDRDDEGDVNPGADPDG